MAKRFKNEATPRHGAHHGARYAARPAGEPVALLDRQPSLQPKAQAVTSHVPDLPEVPLPEHPLPDRGPLSNAAVSEDAPQPIGVDPSVTGAFSTISAADGTSPLPSLDASGRIAIPSDVRGRGHGRGGEGRRGFPKVALALIIATVLCLVAGATLILWNAVHASPDEATGEGQRVEQTEAPPGQPLYYDSYAYTVLQQQDGRWAFVRSVPTGADPLVLFTFDGTPVELVLSDGVFVIPENLQGSWEVAAWVIGDGNVPTLLMGEDGQAVQGEGQLSSASLEGDELHLTAADGAVTTVPLGFWD